MSKKRILAIESLKSLKKSLNSSDESISIAIEEVPGRKMERNWFMILK